MGCHSTTHCMKYLMVEKGSCTHYHNFLGCLGKVLPLYRCRCSWNHTKNLSKWFFFLTSFKIFLVHVLKEELCSVLHEAFLQGGNVDTYIVNDDHSVKRCMFS